MHPLRPWIRLLRPAQWTKNAVVFAAFIFAFGDQTQNLSWHPLGKVVLAALAFCLLSSAVYIFNDIHDAPHDRLHPRKCRRPIASRAISPTRAATLASLLLLLSLVTAFRLAIPLFLILSSYLLLQIAYTLLLKQIPLLDVLLIATGFVLRTLAGAAVLSVPISPWLLICTLLLASFLALCKRRHEKITLPSPATRAALSGYSPLLLDQLIAMTGTATLLSYSIYTLWPETIEKFGTHWLCVTVPFVLFGLFRYLYLVYLQGKGDQPERLLLTDPPLLVDIALYGLTLLTLLFTR